MPVEPAEITEEMLNTATWGGAQQERISDLLNLPETRRIVREATEREHAEMMATLPDWDDMSDLDKGAALMHIWKRDSEGGDYAIENYPVKYIEDPRLTALDREDACAHAARFEDVSEELQEENSNEWSRLYDLALAHERSK
jgi:hypothetical protein